VATEITHEVLPSERLGRSSHLAEICLELAGLESDLALLKTCVAFLGVLVLLLEHDDRLATSDFAFEHG
jgi:hypothetical protein